ncbi:MAG: hypothetical protein H7Z13_20985 [Ferruginibacter sp.]|nr:hypothetical protein [Ferruginibacter sp.]
MWLDESINAKYTKEADRRPMMQKDVFPVNAAFGKYLQHYGRDVELPLLYTDLINYSYADPLKDKKGKWTHWENAVYEPVQLEALEGKLINTFARLKKLPLPVATTQFDVERIDFCEYGNSVPFRIKMVEKDTGQYNFFYVKLADASRIYGLELEHLLTNNPINYLHYQNTLIEEHIEGIPGDVFLQQNPQLTSSDKTAMAKAFVQFNESCFVRLLGDMRSYNFVVNPIVVNGLTHYHIRAIDFDQQSYEGKKILYFPQFYKENADYVELVLQNLDAGEIEQNRQIEFAGMAARIITYRRQLMELVNSMVNDDISENYKIQILRNELNEHFKTTRFTSCKTMGAIVKHQLKQVLQKHVQLANLKQKSCRLCILAGMLQLFSL